ncbi:MAG: hypothetical protein ACI9HA_003525 [Dinoroseobacter sp.]|jgi:hypothetical protein
MNTFSAIVEPDRRLLLEAMRREPCSVNMLVEAANLVVVRLDGQKR